MSEPSFKHDQIQAIKKRLDDERVKHGLTTYKLAEALKKETGFTDINYNTVQSALSFSKDALDITVVIAICRLYHLDTAYILSPPGTPEPALPIDQANTAKFKMLDDSRYFDKYCGYFYSPNHKSGELVRFELEIQSTEGKTTAILHYHGRPRTVNGVVEPDERTMYGTPCLCTRHSNVYIQLTNDFGDFYYLYFNRQEFRSHNMYFRRGVALTASSLRNHPVLQLNFVLFARPVPDEKLIYIPGLLADVSRTFSISKDKMDALRSSNTLIENFYKCFEHILEHDADTVYPINEEQILLSNSPSMDRYDIIKALLLLKDESSASKRVVHEDIEDFAVFSKNYLQQPTGSELPQYGPSIIPK